RGADVVLEWSALPLPHEARIARLARWVDEAEREGRRSLLRLPGQAIGRGRGAAHRHACLRALARLPGAPGEARGACRASHEARSARLARWVDEAEREGRRSLLRLPGQAIGPGRGAAHRHACLRALALLPAAPGDARGA